MALLARRRMRRDELSPYTLDHVHRVLRRHHARQIEARLLIELSKLRLCALAPASSQHEHLEIEELADIRIVTRGENVFDDQESRSRPHGAVTTLKNSSCTLIVPVVDHALHDVGIAAVRDAFEEVSAHHRAAIRQSFASEETGRAVYRMGKFEEDPPHPRVDLQYRSQQKTVATAHVDQGPDPGK